jgi:glycogen debranching enzyme
VSTASPWDTAAPVASVGDEQHTTALVEGQTFCLSSSSGDMVPTAPHGLFVLDTRVLSRWELRLNGARLEPLAVANDEPFGATFVSRGAPAPGAADADLVVFRERRIGRGMRERIEVTNHGLVPAALVLELRCDADFADLFEVKESRVVAHPSGAATDGGSLWFTGGMEGATKRVDVSASPEPDAAPGVLAWRADLQPRESFQVCVEARITMPSGPLEPRFRCGAADESSVPNQRMSEWRARLPIVSTDCDDLARTVTRSGEDLGALRIFDPEHPDDAIVAAGAPWFMTLFGRDSLITAWMTLPADASLAHGVLETLARLQGDKTDPLTEEEPGKILHEVRFGGAGGLALGGGDAYYGSVDASPLFVMLLGELRRWGLGHDIVERLLPHADRALDWIEASSDRYDGYLAYERQNPHGLVNQGWKDSWDAIRFADGTIAEPPIALCEVQGYAYAAHVARAHFARESGDHSGHERHRQLAEDLRRRFNEDFWLEGEGTFALGLDRDGRPIDAVTSNVGHCLWTGIVDPARAPAVAERLLADDMFSGWGVRTLASTMAAYNPVSYHNGSVWPHDNAICAAGLARYGLLEHAHRIIEGQLAVANARDGRLPELFAGFGRADLAVPAAYPASCAPQAWAAAAPLLWLRTFLRLDPWVPEGKVWIAPELPDWIEHLDVGGIRLGASTLAVRISREVTEVDLEGPMRVVREPREPLTAATR